MFPLAPSLPPALLACAVDLAPGVSLGWEFGAHCSGGIGTSAWPRATGAAWPSAALGSHCPGMRLAVNPGRFWGAWWEGVWSRAPLWPPPSPPALPASWRRVQGDGASICLWCCSALWALVEGAGGVFLRFEVSSLLAPLPRPPQDISLEEFDDEDLSEITDDCGIGLNYDSDHYEKVQEQSELRPPRDTVALGGTGWAWQSPSWSRGCRFAVLGH